MSVSTAAPEAEVPEHGQQAITACAFIHHLFGDVRRVFVPRRALSKRFLPGIYELPGGHIEFGEDIIDGLKREIQEEFGMRINVGDPFYAFTYKSTSSHSVEVIYFATFVEPIENIRLNPEDHSEYGWFGEDELAQIIAVNPPDDPEVRAIRRAFALARGDSLNTAIALG